MKSLVRGGCPIGSKVVSMPMFTGFLGKLLNCWKWILFSHETLIHHILRKLIVFVTEGT